MSLFWNRDPRSSVVDRMRNVASCSSHFRSAIRRGFCLLAFVACRTSEPPHRGDVNVQADATTTGAVAAFDASVAPPLCPPLNGIATKLDNARAPSVLALPAGLRIEWATGWQSLRTIGGTTSSGKVRRADGTDTLLPMIREARCLWFTPRVSWMS